MKVPVHLKHKPVFVCENYAAIDGRYVPDSDAAGLSLGLAQWNDRGRVDISAKIWRHTGGKWSRQSEELPLSRVLDLAILICQAKQYLAEEYHTGQPEDGIVDHIDLQGARADVALCLHNPMLEQDKQLFSDALIQEDGRLSERLHLLSNLLQDMGYGLRRRAPSPAAAARLKTAAAPAAAPIQTAAPKAEAPKAEAPRRLIRMTGRLPD